MTLKVKYADFQQITRRRTGEVPVASQAELERFSYALLEPIFPVRLGIRLLGVTLSSIDRDPAGAGAAADAGAVAPALTEDDRLCSGSCAPRAMLYQGAAPRRHRSFRSSTPCPRIPRPKITPHRSARPTAAAFIAPMPPGCSAWDRRNS